MGVSSRPRPRPTRPQTPTSELASARKTTISAALDARAHGLLTEVGLDHVADGKVDSRDLHRAEKILDKAEKLLHEIECSADTNGSHVQVAEQRVDVAQALLDAIGDQLGEQKGTSSRPDSPK